MESVFGYIVVGVLLFLFVGWRAPWERKKRK